MDRLSTAEPDRHDTAGQETTAGRAARPRKLRRGAPAPTVIVMGLGAMITFLQITASVTALDTIQTELGVDAVTLVWIPSAYTLMVASLVLSAAALGGRFGRRRLFLLGVGAMVAGAAVITVAGSAAAVIAGQLVCGVGGALILANSLAILGTMFTDPHRRTEVITGWAAASGVGLALGPVLAGALLQAADWHAVYFSTAVLGLITLGATLPWVGESRAPGVRVDVPGLLLGTITMAASVFALIEGGRSGHGSPVVVAAWLVAAAALAAFLAVETRAVQPMLDVRLFRSPSFSTVMLVAAVSLFGFTGVAVIVVLLLQKAQGLTPLEAGFRMLAMLGAYVVVAACVGPVIRRTGFKAPLAGGLAAAGIAALGLAGQDPLTGFATQAPLFVLFGAGVGLVAAPATAAALASVSPSKAGMASGAVNAARQLGSVLGVSVLGTLATTTMLSEVQAGAALAYALGTGVQAGLLVTGILFLVVALVALTLVRNRPHAALSTTENPL